MSISELPVRLSRKTYTQQELDHAKSAIDRQLAAYKTLVKSIDGATSDPKVTAALEAFEPLFFNNMTLVLDRYSFTGFARSPARTATRSTRSS